jgi:prefoldin subunit 5
MPIMLEKLYDALRAVRLKSHRMSDLTLEQLRTELAPIIAKIDALQSAIDAIRIHTDGLPMLGEAIETLRRDTRSLRAAFNDFAKTNVAAGEVEALHTDVDRVQSREMQILTRLATIERILREHSMLPEERSP